MKLAALILFTLALSPVLVVAQPKPATVRSRTLTTHDRSPKIHQRAPQPHR